jgi:hypothetical protein
MDFRDTLTAHLPPPRLDEPASLRQDILDELGDHLACACNHEILRGLEPAVARARAWERFGDPAAVARRLWLDAMKGKIMAQRALIATCVLVTIISLAVAGLLWLQSTRTAIQVAEANRRMAESMAEARLVNQELLKQSQANARGDRSAPATEWIPVTFKLTQQTLDGPPATGWKVYLGRGIGGSMAQGSTQRESDENGVADFGVVQPGDWEFRVNKLSEDGPRWMATGNINVIPGAKVVKTVICPPNDAENIPVHVRVDWPADLASRDLEVAASFRFSGITYQPPLRWQQTQWGQIAGVRNLLCGPGGKQAEIDRSADASQFFLWQLLPPEGDDTSTGPAFADLLPESLSPASETVNFAAGDYRLARLLVLRPVAKQPTDCPAKRFDFIAQLVPHSGTPDPARMHIFHLEMAPTRKNPLLDNQNRRTSEQYMAFPPAYRSLIKGRFQVRGGHANEWVIPLPDELINTVREHFKPDATAKSK